MDGVLIDSEIVYLNHTFQCLKKWKQTIIWTEMPLWLI